MRRDQLSELQNIAHVKNIRSILDRGILSNARAAEVPHESVAMSVIQDRREAKRVPQGRPLHEYVNLYFNCRNKMMSKVRDRRQELCVLRVDPAVLDLPKVVITDQNAASGYAIFKASPEGLAVVQRDLVFAESWKHPQDQIQEWRHGSIVCAEVLVPDVVPARYIRGAYVSSAEGANLLKRLAPDLDVTINSHLFFADS